MTKTSMDLPELVAKHNHGDLLRSIAEAVLRLTIEVDVDGLIGAGRHERSGERTTWRNGYCDRSLDTRRSTLNLRVLKLRQLLPGPPQGPQDLGAGAGGGDRGGLDQRGVDPPRRLAGAATMGLNGISKSTVSKLCKDIDERVGAFLNRPLTGEWT